MMKAYIFDLDGTLVDGLGNYSLLLKKAIKHIYEKEVDFDLSELHGKTDRAVLQYILNENNIKSDLKTNLSCLNLFGNIFEASKEQTKLIPGAKEILLEIYTQKQLAGVVTGNVTQMAHKKINLYGLFNYLTLGIVGGDFSEERHHLITEILYKSKGNGWEKEWNPKKDVAYVIGDTFRDIEAAKKSAQETGYNIISIGVLTGIGTSKELKEADYIIPSLQNLLNIDNL